MRADLALANHILYRQGVLDAFGHVSARDPDDAGRFWMSKNLAPALVQAEDVLAFDMDGNPVGRPGERVYLERFIHAAIYAVREDVNAIVHSHSPAIVPFTVSRKERLRPVCHMGGFLTSKTPLFEIRDVAGNATDLLIRSPQLGTELARCLGREAAVLMRGHGLTVVGDSLQQAVFRAVYAEKNAGIQARAIALGDVTYLTDEEAASADRANQTQVQRAWEFWSGAVSP